MTPLKQRIATAIVLVAGLLYALFGLPSSAFAWIALAVFVLGAREWGVLAGAKGAVGQWAYALLVGAAGLGLLHFTGLLSGGLALAWPAISLWVAAALWWLVALVLVLRYPAGSAGWGGPVATAAIGMLVLLPSALGLVWLHAQGAGLVLYLILLVAAADIGAFFAGRAFGRHKLAPRVSPGKTWEGFAGGMLASAALAAVGAKFVDGVTLPSLLAVSLVTAFASVLGDLLESMLKRHRGLKDSGRLLPGHGGILDRIDSLTAAAPLFALGWWLAGGR